MNEKLLKSAAEKILKDYGLDFSHEKIKDLKNSFLNSAKESRIKNQETFAELLIENKLMEDELDVLLKNLTVGETYFFRDEKLFAALKGAHVKEIINNKKFMNVWSAGCASGEEPYSFAILFDKFYKEKHPTQFIISASDINKHSIDKAKNGVYRDWSFRSTPDWVKQEYFSETEKGLFEIDKKIKTLVKFSIINLSETERIKNNPAKFDIIICRNVLIYFNKPLIKELLETFFHKLNPGGIFITTASESININKKLFAKLVDSNNSIFVKRNEKSETSFIKNFSALPEKKKEIPLMKIIPLKKQNSQKEIFHKPDLNKIYIDALEKYYSGKLNESLKLFSEIENELIKTETKFKHNAELYFYLIKNNFRTGNILQASQICDFILKKEKLDYRLHYIHGILLQENGEYEKAEAAFSKSIYLNNKFALSFFALGNLQKSSGKNSYKRNFSKASGLLVDLKDEQIIKYSDGISARDLLKQISILSD